MIAAFLVRCSTDKGDYDRQIRDLKKEANKLNFTVDEKYIFGEYVTGRDDTTKGDRRSIRRLRTAAKEKKFDVILVNEVSRMSRDSVSGRLYIRQFNNMGMPIYFRDKGKWTIDPYSRAIDEGFENELGSFFDGAAEYLKVLKTQTASGRRKRLEDNQMVQGKPALGYKKQGGKDKYTRNTVIIDPETAPIIVDTFDTYLQEGGTLKSTAVAMTAKYGRKFSVGRINHILNYAGYYTGQTTVNVKDPDRGIVEPFTILFDSIIDEETFVKTREKLSSNRSYVKPHNVKQKVHLLSRIIKCSYCGHSFSPRMRSDKRKAYNWLCMSRINNANECESHINLNSEKLNSILWNFIKMELLVFTNINKEERESRIASEQERISNLKDEIENLKPSITAQKKLQERAYNAYLNVPEALAEVALEQYNKTLVETKKEIDYLDGRTQTLNKFIKEAEDKITRYTNTDYTESYIREIEADFNKKRALFIEYIKAIYPYKVDYRVVILEVHTVEGVYSILLDANQRKHKVAYYISQTFAIWQNSLKRYEAFEAGDYFLITNPDMVMDSEELEEMVTFKEMIEICQRNDWTLEYEG